MNSHNIQGHLGHCREECERNLPECGEFHRRKQMLWGIVLISIGSAFLLNRLAFINLDTFVGLNTLSWLDWWHLLPLLLALSGLIDIFSARKLSHVGHGFFKVVVGAWLYICLEHIWGWTFSNSWPTILVALGVSIMTGGLQHSRRKSDKESPQ